MHNPSHGVSGTPCEHRHALLRQTAFFWPTEALLPYFQESTLEGINKFVVTIQSLRKASGMIESLHCTVQTWRLKLPKKMARLHCMFKYKLHPKPGKYFWGSEFRPHSWKQTFVKVRTPFQSGSSHCLTYICHTVIILLIQVKFLS